ncbi:MAG: seryl-tRNA synthetase [Parcubacteria group bacterium LiPW_39]|nr:MAG: seryl-tRNA synthetase [Parcubacteria group bacterium LiPW_39]
MLDIKFIRENKEAVKDAVRKKYLKADIDRLLELDGQRRSLIQESEAIKAKQNKLSEKLAKEKNEADLARSKELKDQFKELEKELAEVEKEYNALMWLVPNIPAPDTPIGPDESVNKEVGEWGKIPKFDFKIKDHIELGKKLDIIDTEAGVKVSGFRGYYLKNEGAVLHLALLWYCWQKIIKSGFKPLIGPTLVKEFVLFGSGHFPFGKEEVYQIGNPGKLASGEAVGEPLYLAGTSEPTLLAYFSDKVLKEEELPIKVCNFSPCYRSEVGSYGKDTRGLYRLHEFTKVEQVVLCKNDLAESSQWLEEMRQITEKILQDLKLPYRIVQNSSGDMGAGKYKMYDIETWMPGRGKYGETHSDSNMTDWQARRLNIRYKDSAGAIKFVHALNNTVIASPRILIAILENYQQKDGSVEIPKVLRDWCGFKKIVKK